MKTSQFFISKIWFFYVFVCVSLFVNVYVCEGTGGVQKRLPTILVSTHIQYCPGLDTLGLPI